MIFFDLPSAVFHLTSLRIERANVHVDWYAVPGREIADRAFALLDTDSDGKVSDKEGRAYAAKRLKTIRVEIDGKRVKPVLRNVFISDRKQMRSGLGNVEFVFDYPFPERLGRHTVAYAIGPQDLPAKLDTRLLYEPGLGGVALVSQRTAKDDTRIDIVYRVEKRPTFGPDDASAASVDAKDRGRGVPG